MTKTIHNIVIYHYPCPDGEMSAAIFKDHLVTDNNTHFVPWMHENKEEQALNIKEMLSPRRSRSLARPRQIAMYLSKQHTTNSLPDIGRKFSNRDHTTVIHAVKKIDELMRKDNEIKHSVDEIKKKII